MNENNILVRTFDPSVRCTKDYDVFRRMEGNRKVTAIRSRKIRQSIEKVGYIPSPIVVNEHMEIIDGQGRFEALKQLGLPVFYIVVPNLNLVDCVAMNVNSTPWTLEDYIRSYAETGSLDYMRLVRLLDSYDLPMCVVVCAATGVMSTANNESIKNGAIELDEDLFWSVDKMLSWVEKFVRPMKEASIGNKAAILNALCFCYRCEDVDNARMFDAFTKYCQKLTGATKIEEVLDSLTDIYNFRQRKNKVYITTKYKEYLDGRYPWYNAYWGKRKYDFRDARRPANGLPTGD